MTILRMQDLDLEGKTVLIRQDLNVPLEQGRVVNDTRIRASLASIEMALAAGARVIVMSHLGRPEEGKPIAEQEEASLQPVAAVLQGMLSEQHSVRLVADYLKDPAQATPAEDEVVLLENVRINLGEKSNDDSLSKQYAALCDVFVMDAFGTAHRAQASTHGVAKFSNSCCAGPLLGKELDALARSLESPERPMLAIVGGAKVSSKLEVLESLASKVDRLIVGGGIANTFMAASGINVGRSLCEPDLIDVAKRLMQATEIPIPVDVLVATEFSIEAAAVCKPVADIADDDLILDVGPETSTQFASIIEGMKTIIWNGPIGVFEFPQFAAGTQQLALAIAENKGFSIAGGGETITAIDQFGVTDKISYISTGGGAFLEFMQGEVLPAVEILDRPG